MARSEKGILQGFPWEHGAGIEFIYMEDHKGAGAGIDPGLHPMRQRMWELVALGLFLDGSPAKNIMGCAACSYEEIEPWILRALAPQLKQREPAWYLTARTEVVIRGNPEVAAASCGLPLEVVAASSTRFNKANS